MIQCPICDRCFISSDPKLNRGNLIEEVCQRCVDESE